MPTAAASAAPSTIATSAIPRSRLLRTAVYAIGINSTVKKYCESSPSAALVDGAQTTDAAAQPSSPIISQESVG